MSQTQALLRPKNPSFYQYREQILQLANETFSPMYRHVYKQYWHNSLNANMTRAYNTTDWQNGIYEPYLPPSTHPDLGMNYSRIVIKVVKEISQESAKELSLQLYTPLCKPAGVLDSELIVLVSWKRRGWTRAFRHCKDKGYLTAIFVDNGQYKNAKALWIKLLERLVAPFYEKRLHGLFESLNLQPYQYDHLELKRLYYCWSNIIGNFSYSLGLIVKSFSHTINWLYHKISWIRKAVGAEQTSIQVEREILTRIKPMPIKLQIDTKRKLIEELQDSLQKDLEVQHVLEKNRFLSERDLWRKATELTPEEEFILKCRIGGS
jgi:hypothetical protein